MFGFGRKSKVAAALQHYVRNIVHGNHVNIADCYDYCKTQAGAECLRLECFFYMIHALANLYIQKYNGVYPWFTPKFMVENLVKGLSASFPPTFMEYLLAGFSRTRFEETDSESDKLNVYNITGSGK
jgi:hypothetical protein